MNEYKVCHYHSIKSGLIVCGNDAYVFTLITNGDIISFLKILLRSVTSYNDDMTHSHTMKFLKTYVRTNACKRVIPSIPTIQKQIHVILGIEETSFGNYPGFYMILLHQIYILTFILHYKMPLQKHGLPGNCNRATSVDCWARKDGIHISHLVNREYFRTKKSKYQRHGFLRI